MEYCLYIYYSQKPQKIGKECSYSLYVQSSESICSGSYLLLFKDFSHLPVLWHFISLCDKQPPKTFIHYLALLIAQSQLFLFRKIQLESVRLIFRILLKYITIPKSNFWEIAGIDILLKRDIAIWHNKFIFKLTFLFKNKEIT